MNKTAKVILGTVGVGTAIAVGVDVGVHQREAIKDLSNGLKVISAKLDSLDLGANRQAAPQEYRASSERYASSGGWKERAKRAESLAKEETARANYAVQELRIERQQSQQAQQQSQQQEGTSGQQAPVVNNYNYYNGSNEVPVNMVWPGFYQVYAPDGYIYAVYGSSAFLNFWLTERFWGLDYRFSFCHHDFWWRPNRYYEVLRTERVYGSWGETRLDNGRSFYLSQYDYNNGTVPHSGFFDPAARVRAIGQTHGSTAVGIGTLQYGRRMGGYSYSRPQTDGAYGEQNSRLRGYSPQPGSPAFQNRAENGIQGPSPYMQRSRGFVNQPGAPQGIGIRMPPAGQGQPRFGAPGFQPQMQHYNVPHMQMPQAPRAAAPHEAPRARGR